MADLLPRLRRLLGPRGEAIAIVSVLSTAAVLFTVLGYVVGASAAITDMTMRTDEIRTLRAVAYGLRMELDRCLTTQERTAVLVWSVQETTAVTWERLGEAMAASGVEAWEVDGP